MTTRRKWIVGAVGVVSLAVAAFQLETRYEMGQLRDVALPWQKTRRRLIAARTLFNGVAGGDRFTKFLFNQDEEMLAARARKNRETCDRLAAAGVDYIMRCAEPKEAERERVRAEMKDLVTSAFRDGIGACRTSNVESPPLGPEDEELASCLQFFRSGTCDILDYRPSQLAVGMLDMMVKKPSKPQPHMQACLFLWN
jgi:hypothetical protein